MTNSPGDYTGIQKEALARQHAEEQERRAAEMSMVTAAAAKTKTREVVDYTQPPAPPEEPDTGPIDLTATEGAEDDDVASIVAATRDEGGDETIPLPESQEDAFRAPAAMAPQQVGRTSVLIRSRFDMPQVTIGHGNTYDFETGVQYRVPPNVANHLAERHLVDVIG